jgi:hypothetical protein
VNDCSLLDGMSKRKHDVAHWPSTDVPIALAKVCFEDQVADN